jgi:hypothetical protein
MAMRCEFGPLASPTANLATDGLEEETSALPMCAIGFFLFLEGKKRKKIPFGRKWTEDFMKSTKVKCLIGLSHHTVAQLFLI